MKGVGGMAQLLKPAQTSGFLHQTPFWSDSFKFYLANSLATFRGNGGPQSSRGCLSSCHSLSRLIGQDAHCSAKNVHEILEVYCEEDEPKYSMHVQTLKNFPIKKLFGEVVIVRFDYALLAEAVDLSSNCAFSTIKYLYSAGAKIILVGNWGLSSHSISLSTETLADHLSSLLQVKVVPAHRLLGVLKWSTWDLEKADILLLDNMTKFKEELANCPEFCMRLAAGANIFVNDAFSLSHKMLASTVGIARCCCASVAGFHFEKELSNLSETIETSRYPYMAIIGGRNFSEKAPALHLLASKCDGLLFVGLMAFQIMNALGWPVPSRFVEHNAVREASKLIDLMQDRNISAYFPNDFWCVKDNNEELLVVFPSDAILPGWTPIDLGPLSLKGVFSLLSECKKILWIGPVKFGSSKHGLHGASELVSMLARISKNGCDVIVVGNAACDAVAQTSASLSSYKLLRSASVVWEFLKGMTLPGVAALDKAYPFSLHWNTIFSNPTRPLIVDIGSGNGLFVLTLARLWRDSNFLGLEINKKLVKRCLNNVQESGMKNMYFISSNATSTFHSIVSSYPGEVVLVSIQCPNPDFNREEHRWRMVQRALVEAIIDLLAVGGKIYLQSDIEGVITRMKEQFLHYGKDKLALEGGDENGWLKKNPFGVRSDWEQHVIDRGAPMYRVLFIKV